MIDIGPIGQDHIGNRSPVLVLHECLARDFLPVDECRGGVLGVVSLGLALLREVNAAQADALRVAVQDFDGVAVHDPDDMTAELCRNGPTASRIRCVSRLSGSLIVSGWPWASTVIVVVLLSAFVIVVRLPFVP